MTTTVDPLGWWLPRHQSSDATRAAELHDQHMERLIAKYAAQPHTARPQMSQDDPDADTAPVDNPPIGVSSE